MALKGQPMGSMTPTVENTKQAPNNPQYITKAAYATLPDKLDTLYPNGTENQVANAKTNKINNVNKASPLRPRRLYASYSLFDIFLPFTVYPNASLNCFLYADIYSNTTYYY